MNNSVQAPFKPPLIPWSYWIWLVHIAFSGVLYLYMFTPFKPDWFKISFSAFSLGAETNYAVWWSGICLFIASQLFYCCASKSAEFKHWWKWAILSLAMLALAFDEIGSLHEMVSKIGGWKALLPFALIFAIGFGAALFSLFRQTGFRIPAALILIAISLFAFVASLEYLEHNFDMNKRQQRQRLIFEESLELFAISLIIIAGLLSLKKTGITDRRLSELVGNPQSLLLHPQIVFALFVIQLVGIAGFAIPHSGAFSEGSPAGVFPLILYFILALICFRQARISQNPRETLLWRGLWLLFLFVSLSQMHSFTALLNKFGMDIQLFTQAREIWLITMVPAGLLCLTCLGRTPLIKLIPEIVFFLFLFAILYPDNYSSMTYYMFSGCSAYFCYRLMQYLLQN